MKKTILCLIFCVQCYFLNAQVGIGTSSPHGSAILDLTANNKGLLLPRLNTIQRNALGTVAGLVVFDTDLKLFYQNDGVSWKPFLNSSFWNASATRQYVYNTSDSIGIGTNSPNEKLHINQGNIYVQDNRTGKSPHVIFDVPAVNYKEGGLQFTRLGDTIAGINYVADPNFENYLKLSVSAGGTGADLVVNNNGNTGMGYLDPQVKLHVRSSGAELLRLESVNPMIQFRRMTGLATYADIGFIQTSTDDFKIGINASNNTGRFIIRTGGADQVFVDDGGNVSIGTAGTAAGYKLNVGGKAICEELKVQLEGSWPDYVFNNDYKLKSLDELQAFIKQNNHLPNIPKASQIEKEGLEVGDMQKRMMEKIEELTLYILQLKNEIDQLKAVGK
jgi:hypothetical protein